MNKQIIEESIEINGQQLTLQIGKLAQSVDTSVYATLGGTAVLVTVATGPENPAIDYFPLSVEYVEKLYAGGIIKGSRWVKREGKASDEAVLIGRLIDRSIRPLFPKAYKKQVQVIATLLSVDGENSPDIVAALAVSAALHLSSIPWNGPIATTRIGYIQPEEGIEGSIVVNPNEEEQIHSKLDLVVASSKEKVLMIETKAEILADDIIQKGIEFAKEEGKRIIDFIEGLRAKAGKEKDAIPQEKDYSEIIALIQSKYADPIDKALKEYAQTSHESAMMVEIISSIYEDLGEKYDSKQIAEAIQKYNYANIKKNLIEKKERPDGRKLNEVRPLYVETGILPRTHGSALFQRGQTQILSVVTLGSTSLEQLLEGPEGKEAKGYIHHYSDGPYSYGQAGRMGPPSRRAIGHGALAEKAIEPVLPTVEQFPYAIRVVSEILSENGSSSMGSACGSSLALMHAGVPLKAAVAGVAMGIVVKSDDEYTIMTDIVGLEDFSGEMDFKIAGTADGITAIQLDVKNAGLTSKMISEIFAQGKEARLHILDAMNKVISAPEKDISQYAPKVVIVTVPVEKIGEVIGPGGKNIKGLIARTGCEINIDDDGRVSISGIDREKVEEAASHIANITREIEVGEEFEGTVVRIMPFGAFVELVPGKDGMVHVSKMGKGFVKSAGDVVSVGDKVKVRVYQIDDQGRINLEMQREDGEYGGGGNEGGEQPREYRDRGPRPGGPRRFGPPGQRDSRAPRRFNEYNRQDNDDNF